MQTARAPGRAPWFTILALVLIIILGWRFTSIKRGVGPSRPMVDPQRLIEPQDKFAEAFPGLGFREVYCVRTSGEPILVTDPIYLAEVYNSSDSDASFLRSNGVFVGGFGGDASPPVWWQEPYVLLPIASHSHAIDQGPPKGTTVLADRVVTDSGSFVFLPVRDEMPPELRAEADELIARRLAALLELSEGDWCVFYEQWDAPEERLKGLYRNVVLRRN